MPKITPQIKIFELETKIRQLKATMELAEIRHANRTAGYQLKLNVLENKLKKEKAKSA
ncbi:MAG: hypothetical protein K8I03_16220 [Ignavibacteria bacterium]|nr:hypothetical protein [Ignavibacteria bacterium]